MEYEKLTKEEQLAHIDNDIKNYEGQHFQQKLLADQAQAAHDAVLDDDDDADSRRTGFLNSRKQHCVTVREAEARISALKAARAIIDRGKAPAKPE